MEHKITLSPINIKKLWGNKSNRKKTPVTITIELTTTPQMTTYFTAHITVKDPEKNTIYIDTSNLNDVADLFKSDSTFQQIYEIWQKYHDASIHAGTENQERVLQELVATDAFPSLSLFYLPTMKDYLNSIGLLQDTLSDNTIYTYGNGLINGQAMPVGDKLAIQSLFNL